MRGEFLPGEQDCLDGKRKVDTCEAEIKRALADMKKEAQLNAKEAQLNADKAQLNIENEMVDRVGIAAIIGETNNRIKYSK
jgi:3-dehydroquinate dehydratase